MIFVNLRCTCMRFLLYISLAITFASNINRAQAQEKPLKNFLKLSRPEKWWVIKHPFIARKAFRISKEAEARAKQIEKGYGLKGGQAGGQPDAFRHCFWMAGLAQQIRPQKAYRLGCAHEKGNYLQYKKNKKEDGVIPTKAFSEMDLWNNHVGIAIGCNNKKISSKELEVLAIEAIKKGELKIIRKNSIGNFLTCEGETISGEELVKWEAPLCVIPSNKIEKE
jgi:hypothetical protein